MGSEKGSGGSDKSSGDNPFDLAKLKELVALMEQYGLSEVDLQKEGSRCRLRRGSSESAPVFAPGMFAPPMFAQAAAPQVAATPTAAAPASAPGTFIKSPTVGTYYGSPSPGEEAFVKVGSKVSAETVVCIIEAMKVFNQIPAETGGVIAEILCKNGDAVEYGQPLFRITPA
jgi:acetyl-CoA carboxylase biotin carboxyl carrier protein